ncbi:nucleotide disphospho-sugar-binding domain-containing protein [Dactylosporangium sp. NPDC005572]|uniref:nucleotide disphospho-sugar-binding domain-containing protein n=1 Tax=Dactylosporangium sp. NPDC005572 TaxID=3156889 RepID=UPI0033B134D7
MRILLATVADRSMFHATVPLAWALRGAGHDVRVAAPPGFCPVVTAAGLTAVPVGSGRSPGRLAALHHSEREALRAGLPSPYDAAVGDAERLDRQRLRDGYADMVGRWHKADNFPMIADLVELARAWRPHLVLWEPTTYAGAIAAAACGAAHGRVLWSLDVLGRTRRLFLRDGPPDDDPLAEWLGGYARRHGGEYTEELATGQFTVDPLPDPIALPTGLPRLGVRYTPYGGPAEVPAWLSRPPGRPRVAVTLGVTATERFAGYAVDLGILLAALADLDAEIVATVPGPERERLGRLPANVRTVPWVPLAALAPTCAAVVNHAGPGTLLTVALAGVPQVTVPWDFDEPELARRVAAQDAAIDVPPTRDAAATAGAVRTAVLRVLRDGAARDGAARLQAALLALPPANALVPDLERLSADRAGVA